MFIAAFAASNLIGALPLLIVIAINTAADPSLLDAAVDNPADLSIYGIDPNLALILMVFPFIIGLLTIILLMKPLHGRSFMSIINGASSYRWSRFFISFLLWSLFMAIYLLVNLKLDPSNFTIHNTTKSLIVLAIISLALIPFQAAFEEVLFRGYLMQGIGVVTKNKWVPLLVSSILFGLLHGLNPEIKEFGFFTMMPQYITFGFLFGLITVLDNGIELALGAHAANNIFLSVFVTQKSSTLQTAALFEQQEVHPWAEYIYLIVLSAMFVAALYMIYKWKVRESFAYKD